MRKFRVNTIPNGIPVVIHCNQFETGDTWKFVIFSGDERYNIPAGATVKFQGTKSNKETFTISCTVSNNEVLVTVTDDITSSGGKCIAEIYIKSGDVNVYTANMLIAVEDTAGSEDES